MAGNGIPQLGPPRIGQFADRLPPEPRHCEINAWQHYIDLLYFEAVRQNKVDAFVSVLGAPIRRGDEDNVDDECPQKSLMKISGLESVGKRTRQQEILQKKKKLRRR